MRDITARRQHQTSADLFYHRARQLDLSETYRSLHSALDVRTTGTLQVGIEGYRLYMAMLELMAAQRIKDPVARAHFLNRQCAQFNELSELGIKGFNRLANRREREIFSR